MDAGHVSKLFHLLMGSIMVNSDEWYSGEHLPREVTVVRKSKEELGMNARVATMILPRRLSCSQFWLWDTSRYSAKIKIKKMRCFEMMNSD